MRKIFFILSIVLVVAINLPAQGKEVYIEKVNYLPKPTPVTVATDSLPDDLTIAYPPSKNNDWLLIWILLNQTTERKQDIYINNFIYYVPEQKYNSQIKTLKEN